MKISSPAFKHGDRIPVKYTSDGENINPELIIESVPSGAKSLVLIVDDPDAPSGTWTHWILYDLPPDLTKIPENSSIGMQGVSTSNQIAYSGPCPPSYQKHRYFFRLFALDIKIGASEGFSRDQIEKKMLNHIIESTEIMGYFSRG
ncbi:MAG: YbhB/YbcL family Raf kinase inhibitor-like protein [Fibrobacter sp.]|nr:YbhB/YbcL family Raf kinase inhibitor-like protein [Fibrobacter sp.]